MFIFSQFQIPNCHRSSKFTSMKPVPSYSGQTRPRKGWGSFWRFYIWQPTRFDEIIPSCDVNITRSDHRDTTTYSAFVTNCMAPIYESFIPDVTKTNKSVASRDYLDTGRQETSSVNMTTVSFNSTVMSNENVVLNSLMFRIYSYQDFPLKGLMLTYDRQYSIL